MAIFRYAEPEDLSELMEVVDAVDVTTKEKTREILLERIQQQQLLCVAVDQKVVGFIGWSKNYDNDSQACFVEQITVHNDFRRRGLGLRLLRYFLDICTSKKIHLIYATIQKDNEKSLAMFKKIDGITVDDSDTEYTIRIKI